MGLHPTPAPTALVRESRERKKISIGSLLRPHIGALLLGFIAIAGESAANLLQPWPLKIVLDDVLRSHESHAWTMNMIHRMVGTDEMAVLKFACAAVLAIAVLDAICTYAEKYLTTSVAQWISYDLRLTIYAHFKNYRWRFHDKKRTGDLISRVTDDIEAIQSFIMNGLLGVLINAYDFAGHDCRDVLAELEIHADCVVSGPDPVRHGLQLHAQNQEGVPGSTKERRRNYFGG